MDFRTGELLRAHSSAGLWTFNPNNPRDRNWKRGIDNGEIFLHLFPVSTEDGQFRPMSCVLSRTGVGLVVNELVRPVPP